MNLTPKFKGFNDGNPNSVGVTPILAVSQANALLTGWAIINKDTQDAELKCWGGSNPDVSTTPDLIIDCPAGDSIMFSNWKQYFANGITIVLVGAITNGSNAALSTNKVFVELFCN